MPEPSLPPPLRVKDASGTPNLIPVFELAVSGGTLTKTGAGKAQLLIDSVGAVAPLDAPYLTYGANATLTAERVLLAGTALAVASDATNFFVSLVTPVSVSSGGTGASTFTAFGLLYGSGASALQAEAAMNSGQLIVGSGLTTRPHLLGAGAAGQYLISTGGVVGGVAWINTAGAGSSVVYAATGNAYLAFDAAADLTNERVFVSGSGLSVASDTTTFFASVNTNVRDKLAVFFAAGSLSTVMRAEEIRLFTPFNMQVLGVRLAVTTTPVGQNILVNVSQFGTPVAAGTAFFAGADRPVIVTGGSVGTGGALASTILYTGSYLGFSLDQVGTVSSGQDLTITVLLRTS